MPTTEEIRAQIAKLETDLRAAEEAERKAAEADNAKRALALLSAMRLAYREIERLYPGTFGEAWAVAATSQAWPRSGKFKRIADLSETEVANAQEAGEKAVAGIR